MITPAARGPAGAIPRPPARPGRPAGTSAKAKRPPWGWLEVMVLAQTAVPALLFIPGMSAAAPRFLSRVGFYALILVAWGFIAMRGRPRPGSSTFPPQPWLLFCCGYLGLTLFIHPNNNSLFSSLAQLVLNITILSPAFWSADAMASPRQIPRLMAIAFVANSLSAAVGLGQIYQPERFNPPVVRNVSVDENFGKLVTDAGVDVFRPCGLTDNPGGACVAGQAATTIGLCWALAPIPFWRRLASVGLAVMGLAVVYFTQVRSILIITVLSLIAIVVILAMQRDFRRAILLGAGGTAVVLGAFAWAIAVMGGAVGARVGTLFAEDPGKVYHSNRGRFLEQTINEFLPKYPLGAGLGRWGMMFAYFGDRNAPPDKSSLWAEIQITGWVYDGGAPLMIAYLIAATLALTDSLRIALMCRDKDLAFWAGVIAACNFGSMTMIISYPIFVAPAGAQFWLLSAAVHAADRRVRLASAGPPRRAVAA